MLTYFSKLLILKLGNMKKLKLLLLVAIPALMMACNQAGSGNENRERSDESGMRGRSYDNDQDTVKQRSRTDQSGQSGRSTTTSPSTGSQTDTSGTQRSDTARTTAPGSSGTGTTPR